MDDMTLLVMPGGCPMTDPLAVTHEGRTLIVAINRPERRNAVDLATARALHWAFIEFDADGEADVAYCLI